MKRCGLYLRVSTEEQVANPEGSLKSQQQRLEEELQRRSQQNGAVWVVQKVYREEGRSGKDTNRPAFQAMVRDVEAGLLDAVFCTEISRVSRSTLDLLNFLKFLREHDVEFVSVKQRDFDTTTSTGKVFMVLCAALAEFERDQVSERTSANLQARARRGLFNGSPPFGYAPDPEKKGWLKPDPQEAPVVQLAFDLYLAHGSFKSVADELNRRGLRQAGYVSRRGRHHAERGFRLTGIQHLLTNKSYAGLREINKKHRFKDQSKLPEPQRYTVIDAVWPPIVPRDTFDEVQRLIEQNHRTNHNVAKGLNHLFLLSGIIRCGYCDVSLEGGSGTSRSGRVYHYYRHFPASSQQAGCQLPQSVEATMFEQVVIMELGKLSEDERLMREVAEASAKQMVSARPQLETQMHLCEHDLLQLKGEADALMKRSMDFDRAHIEEFVTPRLGEISDRKRQLTNEIADLRGSLNGLSTPPSIFADLQASVKLFALVIDQLEPYKQRELLGGLIARCVLTVDCLQLALRRSSRAAADLIGVEELSVITLPLRMIRGAHGKWRLSARKSDLDKRLLSA